jgi:hypothetical protein
MLSWQDLVKTKKIICLYSIIFIARTPKYVPKSLLLVQFSPMLRKWLQGKEKQQEQQQQYWACSPLTGVGLPIFPSSTYITSAGSRSSTH